MFYTPWAHGCRRASGDGASGTAASVSPEAQHAGDEAALLEEARKQHIHIIDARQCTGRKGKGGLDDLLRNASWFDEVFKREESRKYAAETQVLCKRPAPH